jgi:hypothetical protein
MCALWRPGIYSTFYPTSLKMEKICERERHKYCTVVQCGSARVLHTCIIQSNRQITTQKREEKKAPPQEDDKKRKRKKEKQETGRCSKGKED